MAKPFIPESAKQRIQPARARKRPAKEREPVRRGGARAAGEMIADIGAVAFRRFGFVQSAVVSRWSEIVGERYARVSTPESIRFAAGTKSGGTLSLLVEGAHAPVMQHLAPLIIERVNRFFGYQAVARLRFRQGAPPTAAQSPPRPLAAPVPVELGEGLRRIADPELRACLESLASKIAGSTGPPAPDQLSPITIPDRSELPKS